MDHQGPIPMAPVCTNAAPLSGGWEEPDAPEEELPILCCFRGDWREETELCEGEVVLCKACGFNSPTCAYHAVGEGFCSDMCESLGLTILGVGGPIRACPKIAKMGLQIRYLMGLCHGH